jgi:hypothetical protein
MLANSLSVRRGYAFVVCPPPSNPTDCLLFILFRKLHALRGQTLVQLVDRDVR